MIMLEVYVTQIGYLAAIFGVAMALAYLIQIYKIYKRKSSADVSVTMYFVLLTGFIIWLLYGIGINNMPLIITYGVSIATCVGLIITYYIYKK